MVDAKSQTAGPSWRVWLSRVVVISTVVMAALTWQRFQPVEYLLALGLGPTVRADDGHGLSREAIRRIEGRVLDEENQDVARFSQVLDGGVSGPTTPPVVLRIPVGTYRVHLLMEGSDGRQVRRSLPLVIEDEGYHRIDVD